MVLEADEEVTEYLANIKECISENIDNLKIASNRDINLHFMIKYGLSKIKIIEIIKELTPDNFEEKVLNKHSKYSKELLYIFSKKTELTNSNGEKKKITIYIKFNFIKPKVILISFHEAKYKFKEKC